MANLGLLIDYQYCTGCYSCEVACQLELGLPIGQYGIKVTQLGPWKIEGDKWQFAFVPVPTEQCDLCEARVAQGKLPTCVHHCQAKVMTYGPVDELAKELDKKRQQVLFVP